ncbi:hypothetical protein BGX30_012064 [Mortierella sp. GBA39]|nr:hypothetical protein BGX30_012064 [Mortierella sp. GBA39]
MLTSRGIHEAIEPWFYHNLGTYSNKTPKGLNINLCDSPDGLRALSRNIHFVRTWETDLFNLVFISRATAAIQQYLDYDNNGSTNSGTGSDMRLDIFPAPLLLFLTWTKGSQGRIRRPPITRAISFDLLRLIPLPPVLSLSRLSLSLPLFFKVSEEGKNLNHILPAHSSILVATARVCAILSRLPQLLDLTLRNLVVKDPRCLQLLTSTLLKMATLRRLELYVDLRQDILYSGLALFFGSPPLIEKLRIEFVDHFDEYDTEDDDNDTPIDDPGDDISVKTIQTVATGAPSCRTVPLGNLRELIIVEGWLRNATPEEVLSMFESCPALEKLVLNWVCFPVGVDGADIGRICPNLRDFTCIEWDDGRFDKVGSLGIMETLPGNRLEILDCSGERHCVDSVVAERTLLRHSCSLRQINIFLPTTSRAIQMILRTCRVLEELHIIGSSIALRDAVAFPWASSKMTRLTLDLNIALSSAPYTQYGAFYLQTPPVAPSADENRIFAQLDVFYRQIGKQADLRYLSLNRTNYDGDEQKTRMPGMLRLTGGNSSSGGMDRPGFLGLLGGLKYLEVLDGGAIYSETVDGNMHADTMEAYWIRTHWPLLRKTGFLFVSR